MITPTDMLQEARAGLAETLEEIGAVAMHLRESIEFAGKGSMPLAIDSVEDAQAAIDNAIRELTRIRDRAGRWAVWAEGKEGQPS